MRALSCMCAAVLAVILAGCSGATATRPPAVEDGERLIKAGRMSEARDTFASIVAEHPEDARAQFYLGVALSAMGDNEGARKAYEDAIKANPGLPEPYNNLGVLLFDSGDAAGAVSLLKKAVKLAPAYAEAWYSLGLALEETGSLDGAEEAYVKAVEADPESSVDPLIALGQLSLNRGDLENAHEKMMEANKAAPDDPLPWYNIGLIRLKQGNADEGAGAFMEAAARSDSEEDAELMYVMAEQLRRMQKFPQARNILEKLVKSAPSPDVKALSSLALVLEKQGEVDGAVDRLHEAERAAPGDAMPLFLLGNVLARNQRFEEAVAAFEKVLEKDRDGKYRAETEKRLKICRDALEK